MSTWEKRALVYYKLAALAKATHLVIVVRVCFDMFSSCEIIHWEYDDWNQDKDTWPGKKNVS